MRKISSLTADPRQTFNAVISGYASAVIVIEYRDLQYGWFISVQWGSFVLNNERVSNSPNLLRQFQNLLPFGIMISGKNDVDPMLIDSWVTTNDLYIVDSTDFDLVDAEYVR